MRSHDIDEDALRNVQAALDMVKVYKMLHDRKIMPKSDYSTEVIASDDFPYYIKYEFLENSYGYIFGDYANADYYIVNEPESEITADFPGVEEFYPYDEFPINGIVINHPAIKMYRELCEEHDVYLGTTVFANDMYRMDTRLANVGHEGYYSEIFLPEEKLIDKYNICIFYTDVDWFGSYFLELFYDAIDYVMDVVTHPQFNKDMLTSREALDKANGK